MLSQSHQLCMYGWMTCDFTSFSTVFQSYQDEERLTKHVLGCLQWNSVYDWEDFASSGIELGPLDQWASV